MPELPELDPVVHGKLRLAVLSLLIGDGRGGLHLAAAKDRLNGRQPGRADAEAGRGGVRGDGEAVRRAQAADDVPPNAEEADALSAYIAAMKQLLGGVL